MAKKRSKTSTNRKTRSAPSAGRSGARTQKKKSTKSGPGRFAKKKSKRPFKKGPRPGGVSTRNRRGSVSRRSPSNPDELRLQRFLAKSGFGSRRECEELITAGRVMVDGDVVQELGSRVNPDKQKVMVDGQRVVPERLEYFILNKPPGVLSTSRDPEGRLRVIDLIKSRSRVYNVGRLDKSSEGLILVTNDGDLANRLTHPSYGIAKTYHVQVEGEPTRETLQQLIEGVYLAEGFAKMANVKFKKRQKNTTWLEIILEEGRNREIRRLLARVGHKVLKLRRIAIGPLRLGELPLGAHRRLEDKEIRALRYAKGNPTKSKGANVKGARSRKSSTGSRAEKPAQTAGRKSDRPTSGSKRSSKSTAKFSSGTGKKRPVKKASRKKGTSSGASRTMSQKPKRYGAKASARRAGKKRGK